MAQGTWRMRAAAYVRVSTESQVDNWSLPAQKRELENYCIQKGWMLVKTYSEEGISAHTDSIEKRPQFKRLLDDCKKGEMDVILVHSLDRWSRNLKVTLESFKLLSENRVSFASVTENIDYSSPEGRLFLAMLGAFAQYYSDSLSKHTSKGMRERAMSGLQNGDVPFGYQKCNKDCPHDHKGRVHIIEKEAEAVKKLFYLYSGGGWSLSKLAEWLNEQGFRTKNKGQIKQPDGSCVKGPRPFTTYSIRWLLHNSFFAGKIHYSGQTYKGMHEPIIDESLYDKVQVMLKEAKSRCRTHSPRFRQYLLKGIIRCIYCGYPLWSETDSKGYMYYREQRNSHGVLNCPANGKAIRCDVIDQTIDNIIQSLILEPSWRERIISKLSNFSEREHILRERKRVHDKLRRLAKAYVDGIIEDSDYNLQRKLLQDSLNSLVVPEADAAMNAGEFLESLGLIWSKATLEEKHKLLAGMLEAVFVDLLASRTIVGIQPKPAFRALFESLKQNPESKVTVFTPEDIRGKITDSLIPLESDKNFGMVEAREGRTPRPEKSCQHFYRLSLLFMLTRSASAGGVQAGQLINLRRSPSASGSSHPGISSPNPIPPGRGKVGRAAWLGCYWNCFVGSCVSPPDLRGRWRLGLPYCRLFPVEATRPHKY